MCRRAEAAVTTLQQHSIKGQTNEDQSLKSKQTFRFEAERYFEAIFEVFAPRASCLCAHHPTAWSTALSLPVSGLPWSLFVRTQSFQITEYCTSLT